MKHRWQPGQSGNPLGRPVLPEDLREIRKLTSRLMSQILTKCLLMTAEELKEKMLNPETSSMELIICRTIVKGIEEGDEKRLRMLLEYTIGKPVEKVEQVLPKPTVIKLRNEEASIIIGRMTEEETDGQ